MDFIDPNKVSKYEADSLLRGKVLAIFNGLEILLKEKISTFFHLANSNDKEKFTKIVLDEATLNYSTLVNIFFKCYSYKYKPKDLENFRGKFAQAGKLRNKLVHGYLSYYYEKGVIKSTYINHDSKEDVFEIRFKEFDDLVAVLIQHLLMD